MGSMKIQNLIINAFHHSVHIGLMMSAIVLLVGLTFKMKIRLKLPLSPTTQIYIDKRNCCTALEIKSISGIISQSISVVERVGLSKARSAYIKPAFSFVSDDELLQSFVHQPPHCQLLVIVSQIKVKLQH